MNRWVALDPAYPPLAGDPLMAAPLLTTTTTLLPGGSGFSSASRSQDEHLRLVLVQQAPRHRRVGRIRDLGPDVCAGGGQLGKCLATPGDRDHRSTSLG